MKHQWCRVLTLIGGFALLLWGLGVALGTGIGYDHPIHSLFDGGIISSIWRLFKAGFLGVLGWGTISFVIEDWAEDRAG
jgi:hypothetical protein